MNYSWKQWKHLKWQHVSFHLSWSCWASGFFGECQQSTSADFEAVLTPEHFCVTFVVMSELIMMTIVAQMSRKLNLVWALLNSASQIRLRLYFECKCVCVCVSDRERENESQVQGFVISTECALEYARCSGFMPCLPCDDYSNSSHKIDRG